MNGKDDQLVKDLDLEQMFEVFDAADKGKSISALPSKKDSNSNILDGGKENDGEGANNTGVLIGLIAGMIAGGFFLLNH